MSDYKEVLGVLAIVIGVLAYIPYLRDLFKGETKPHVFSWLIWGLITAIAFFAQASRGAGAGIWVEIFTFFICMFVAGWALFRGEKNITRTDWICFLGAMLAIVMWAITKEPLTAVILIILIDILAFVPTYRKSYSKPFEETLFTYLLSGIKFIPALFAVTSFNLTTVLYPSYLILANIAFVAFSLLRRRAISAENH